MINLFLTEYLKLASEDEGLIKIIKKIIQKANNLKKGGYLNMMIQLIYKDPFFKPKIFSSDAKIVQNYIDNFQIDIKNVVDKVPAIRLSRKEAVLKASDVFLSKLNEKEKEIPAFLKKKFLFSNTRTDHNLVYELFLELKKNEVFYPIARKWFENIENPFHHKFLY